MENAAIDRASATRLSAATSFAGVLASLQGPDWSDEGLADDVATISYEHALRKQARPRGGRWAGEGDAEKPATQPAEIRGGEADAPAPGPRRVKSASITIRLSEPECAQVRQRAAEAGLTVSGYLRSCTLEVESLRAQVKETLAQLRSAATATPERGCPGEKPRGVGSIFARAWHWIRIWGRWRGDAGAVNPANPLAPVRY